jgi:hypothetical protein
MWNPRPVSSAVIEETGYYQDDFKTYGYRFLEKWSLCINSPKLDVSASAPRFQRPFTSGKPIWRQHYAVTADQAK